MLRPATQVLNIQNPNPKSQSSIVSHKCSHQMHTLAYRNHLDWQWWQQIRAGWFARIATMAFVGKGYCIPFTTTQQRFCAVTSSQWVAVTICKCGTGILWWCSYCLIVHPSSKQNLCHLWYIVGPSCNYCNWFWKSRTETHSFSVVVTCTANDVSIIKHTPYGIKLNNGCDTQYDFSCFVAWLMQ